MCAPFGKDAEILTEIVSSEGLGVTHCASLNELAQQFSERTDFILLTEEALVSSSLQAIQRTLRKQEPWSDVPNHPFGQCGRNAVALDDGVRV